MIVTTFAEKYYCMKKPLFFVLLCGMIVGCSKQPVENVDQRTRDDLGRMRAFFEQKDSAGITNAEKAGGSLDSIAQMPGVVIDSATGKLIGLGIHIFNEDVYPIKKFEIYSRKKGFVGHLDLSDCQDFVFLDVYRNKISSVDLHNMPSIRIVGLQDNCIDSIDASEMPACQGIDIGLNQLRTIDVSHNPELVEFYIHYNNVKDVDLSHNPKLRYFYCYNNRVEQLDVTKNPNLIHLDCTNNPLRWVKAWAPKTDGQQPLSLSAEDGGYVGLKFNPVYTPDWKETGEWQQSYHAYPLEGYAFDGWYSSADKLSSDSIWIDEYGTSRELTAKFVKCQK